MRFFFHSRRGATTIRDHEGTEFPDIGAAVREAIQAAREIMAARLLAGQPMNGEAFEIHDETGKFVRAVPFKDALPAE